MIKKFWKELNSIQISFIIITLLFLIVCVFKRHGYIEPMTIQQEKYKEYENNNLFDDFYSEIYDQLVFVPSKNIYELAKIQSNIKQNSIKKVLDIGCGTGHHCEMLRQSGIKCIGLDKSAAMIKKAMKNHKHIEFKRDDALNTSIFMPGEFDLIMVMYFTIYYIENKSLLFENLNLWLQPGGYIVIHLVDPDKFEALLPSANPLQNISLQNYSKNQIKKSTIYFDKFKYTANYTLHDNNIGNLKEKFIFKDGNVREQTHTLLFDNHDEILDLAQQNGFIVNKKIHMAECGYDNHYLYILQKPK